MTGTTSLLRAEARVDAGVLQRLQRSERGLLVQLAGLGDLIMALPAIESLQAFLPHVRWTMLTRSPQDELIADRAEQVSTIPWPPSAVNLGAIIKSIGWLRRQRFDVAINLYGIRRWQGAMTMKTLFSSIHPCLSIGRIGSVRWRLFDVTWEESLSASQHEIDLNLAMVESLGVPSQGGVPSFLPHEPSLQRVSHLLTQRFPPGRRFVALFPGGARRTRHWPVTNYRILAACLSGLGVGVCVVGGQAERQAAGSIAEAAGVNGLNLAGELSLHDLAALLSFASVYVGNDSGPTHLAAALGIPCVALFGPGDPARFRPRGAGEIRVLQYKVECSPCYITSCDHHTCMRSLTLGEVIQATTEILGLRHRAVSVTAAGQT